MQVFVTGGTGYIGKTLISELMDAGHGVVALTRSTDKAPMLESLGAIPLEGNLHQPGTWRRAAAEADAAIHAAFDYGAPEQGDRAALDALLEATAEGGGHLIYTSGCWVVGDTGGEVVGDDAPTDRPAEIVRWRVPHEREVVGASREDRPAAVVRPGIVYGREGGLVARMFETARDTGAAEFVGGGFNHWSLVHVDDLARLYRIVLEEGAEGIVQAVDGEPTRVADVAGSASLAAGAGGETRPVPLEDAGARIGAMADALCLDQRLSAPKARELGWEPERESFTEAVYDAYAEWEAAAGGE